MKLEALEKCTAANKQITKISVRPRKLNSFANKEHNKIQLGYIKKVRWNYRIDFLKQIEISREYWKSFGITVWMSLHFLPVLILTQCS